MGVINSIFDIIFGGNRNVLRETVEVFRPNAEADAIRHQDVQMEAMRAFSREFDRANKGWFDRMMDGVNRIPRPMMALGCIALFTSAMYDPVWFAQRMQGIALVPEPLWWLLGVIVSFYFGARHQAKNQEFQKTVAGNVVKTAEIIENISALKGLSPTAPKAQAAPGSDTPDLDGNAALEEWRRQGGDVAKLR